jgi:hypothetical protein
MKTPRRKIEITMGTTGQEICHEKGKKKSWKNDM